MDLLKLIKEKCESFSDTEISQGLESVISHIEIAERHLEMGKWVMIIFLPMLFIGQIKLSRVPLKRHMVSLRGINRKI